MLELRGLSKRFGGLVVIDDLSTTLRPGELLGVVGPNGAGKTTLFGLIAGDLRPDAGAVIFDGRDVTSLRVSRRCRAGIGRTYQIPLPFSGMTVFENVLVGATHGHGARGRAAYRTLPERPISSERRSSSVQSATRCPLSFRDFATVARDTAPACSPQELRT